MSIAQGNPMSGTPTKYISHSVAVGVEYYNYSPDSGRQESSQSFTMNRMFRPLQTPDMQPTPDWARPLHLVWSPDTHTVMVQ